MQLPILGEVIYWKMGEVRIDVEKARSKAEELGLVVSVNGLSEVAAMRKALDIMMKSEEEDIIWRPGTQNGQYYVAKVKIINGIKTESAAIVKKVKQETGDIVFDYSGDAGLCSKIRTEFERWKGYNINFNYSVDKYR